MMTFINSFSREIGAMQNLADALADSSLDKAGESGDDEFAGLLALMEIVPAALPVEKEFTGGGDWGLEEPKGEEPIQACQVPIQATSRDAYQFQPFNGFRGVTDDQPATLYRGSPAEALEMMNDDLPGRFAKEFMGRVGNSTASGSYRVASPLDPVAPARGTVPYQLNFQPHSVADVVTRALNTAKIISQAAAENESSSTAAPSILDQFDKNRLFHFRPDGSVSEASFDGREAKASPPETSFCDIVRLTAPEGKFEERFFRGVSSAPLSGGLTGDSLPSDKDNRGPDLSMRESGEANASFAGEAARLAETQSSTSSHPASIAHQVIPPVIEIASQLSPRETRRLRIELHPEKFGQIDLEITRGADGRLSASLSADTNTARHALAEGINHLRESLQQSGLTVDRLEVRLAFGSEGKAGNNAPDDGQSMPVCGADAGMISSETDEDARTSEAEGRLLSLRI